MIIRQAEKADYPQLAQMKWTHAAEDDIDYGESNLLGVNKDSFIAEFTDFLKNNKSYKIFVAEENSEIISAMFVSVIPKLPKPNGNAECIAYLTNVFTKKEYRNKGIGTRLIEYIKEYLTDIKCELIIVFPSDNSVRWYERNGFVKANDVFLCGLIGE